MKSKSYFIIILICCFIPLNKTFSKKHPVYWMPVEYLESIKNKDTNWVAQLKLRRPIEGIIVNKNSLDISSYRSGDFWECDYKIIKKTPLQIKLSPPPYLMPLIEIDSTQKYTNAEYIFEFTKDTITGMIRYADTIEVYKYTKYIYDKKLNTNWKYNLLLLRYAGNYKLLDSNGKILDTAITIKPEGNIENSSIFKNYIPETYSTLQGGYDLVEMDEVIVMELMSKTKVEYRSVYNVRTNTIELYRYDGLGLFKKKGATLLYTLKCLSPYKFD